MKKSLIIIILILICLSSFVYASPPNPDRYNVNYKIVNMMGFAYAKSATDDVGWTPILTGRSLEPGDQVRTTSNSRVAIMTRGGGYINMGPNSQITVTKKILNDEEVTTIEFLGISLVQVKNLLMTPTEDIDTPTCSIGIRGTQYKAIADEEKTEIIVYEGSVYATSFYDNQEYVINAGEKGVVYSDKPAEITKFEDNTQLEIDMKDLCGNQIISNVEYTDELTKSLLEKSLPEGTSSDDLNCILTETRPEFTFFANKFLNPSTVNENTFIVSDERNNQVDGYLDVSDTITFIPDKPLYGKIKVLLKKDGICSKFGVCLEKDISFEVQGVEYKENSDFNFRLTPIDPVKITRKITIANNGDSKKNAAFSIPSFSTYYPNIYYKLYEVSPDIDYDLKGNENKIFKINIALEPKQILIYNLTYVGLSFGREYYQYIDVSNVDTYKNLEIVNKFTLPEEGIESDDQKIIELSNKIVGEEKNPFWKAYRIYNWITTTIKYNFDEEYSGGALATIERKEGVCQDFTQLFMALSRAQKIPTRYVELYKLDDFEKGHAIPEIYIEKIGWIPIDPTWGTNFDNFARQESFLIPNFKQEIGSEKNYLYYLEGENTNDLDVSIVTNAHFLEIGEEEWVSYFGDSFLKSIYKLVAISNINLGMDNEINYYNQLSQKELFKKSFNQAEKNPFYIVSNSVQSYRDGNFNENELKETFIEQLGIAITTFSEMVDYIFSEGLYGHTSIIKNETKSSDEIYISLNNTREEMNIARNQFNSNEYSSAFKGFMNTYLNSYEEVRLTLLSITSFDAFLNEIPLMGKLGITVLVVLVLSAIAFIFWVWMFIHCLTREKFRHLNKFWWAVIIFFVYFLGAVIYFFSEFIKKSKT